MGRRKDSVKKLLSQLEDANSREEGHKRVKVNLSTLSRQEVFHSMSESQRNGGVGGKKSNKRKKVAWNNEHIQASLKEMGGGIGKRTGGVEKATTEEVGNSPHTEG